MPAAKYRGKYPQYDKPERYKNLRYRVSNKQSIEIIRFGLELACRTLDGVSLSLALKEIERIKKLQVAREDHKAFLIRRKAHNKRENNFNYSGSSRIDSSDNRDDEG